MFGKIACLGDCEQTHYNLSMHMQPLATGMYSLTTTRDTLPCCTYFQGLRLSNPNV